MSPSYMEVGGEDRDSSLSEEELLGGSRFPEEMQSDSDLTMTSTTLLNLVSVKIEAESLVDERSTLSTYRTSPRLAERAVTATSNPGYGGVDNTSIASTDQGEENLLERIRELENKNQMSSHTASKLQVLVDTQDETIQNLQSRLAASEAGRKQTTQKLADAVVFLEPIRKENEELKTRLLKMQPANVVSDAQINEKYEELCDDMEDWMDTHLGDTDDVVERTLARAKDEGYGNELGQYLDHGLWKLLRGNIGSQTKFLTCIMQRFIMDKVFSQYAAGMPKEIIDGLHIIEEQMRVAAGEDSERISSWRAEAVRALVDSPQLVQSRKRVLTQVTSNAWYLLEPFFPQHHDQERAITAFHERITVGAWELSRQIRGSPVEYRFQDAHIAGRETFTQGLRELDREWTSLVDAETGAKVKRLAEILFDQQGCFARRLCVIFPALVRRTPSGQTVRLGKAQLLVQMNKRPPPASVVRRLVNTLTG